MREDCCRVAQSAIRSAPKLGAARWASAIVSRIVDCRSSILAALKGSPVPASATVTHGGRGGSSLELRRWREVDSNFWFLVARPSNRHGRRTAVLKTAADLSGNRKFESVSLQGRVQCELPRTNFHQVSIHAGQCA